jgi:hypothetical protein
MYEGMDRHHSEEMRTYAVDRPRERGWGTGSAGQSGDTQGLSDVAESGAQSIEELLEEGQSFEAEAIGGVEDARDAELAEVHTRQFAEDDVPPEYRGRA